MWAYAQINDEEARKWNQPVKPFKVIGNVYYVGATEVSSFLITTSEGHILLDSGFLETVPQIQQNVAQLGFRFQDIKILLNSHAHYDHAGGLARLKELTGAKLMVSEGDVAQLARGGKDDPNFGDRFLFTPVTVDRMLRDGYTVKLGDVSLTALLTPGHTKGCTTWTMKVRDGAKMHDVVFVGSTTAPGYKLVDNDKYSNIAQDYELTFRLLKNLPVDVFVAAHGSTFGLLGFAQKGSFGMNLLCGPPSNLCVSAFNGHFHAEAVKIRRAPQRKRIKFATFCAKSGYSRK